MDTNPGLGLLEVSGSEVGSEVDGASHGSGGGSESEYSFHVG